MIRYNMIRAVMKLIQVSISRMDVYGRENIPESGPYIVVVNHMSVADTPILLMAFPPVEWRFFAGKKWRSHPVYGPIMSRVGAIFIDQGGADREGLREGLTAVANGAVFGLAPEAHRSKNGKMQPAMDGAAYLASRSNVPVVPVGLINTDVLFGNAKRLRRTRLEVRIGKPVDLPDLGRRARSRDMAAYTQLIMVHIAAQLPARYHGVYQDSPALRALLAGQDPWPHCQK